MNTAKNIVPIILCGGQGSRLWPVSRKHNPKFFINLENGYSFLQNTFLRAISIPQVSDIVIVTNSKHFNKVKQHITEINNANNPVKCSYILEPYGRNTAPAICASSLQAIDKFNDDTFLLVLPADQIIKDNEAFLQSVNKAVKLAEENKIVTFGIIPTSPEIGYGYIKALGNTVINFIEKPCIDKAKKFLASGEYLWNAGIFCFRPKILIREAEKHCPEIISSVKKCYNFSINISSKLTSNSVVELNKELFVNVPNQAIDYAILEKSKNIAVVSCDLKWQDIGSWQALSSLYKSDKNGNRLKGNVLTHDSKNCVVKSENRTIALVNVENIIVIDTPDALLVSNKDNSQNVRFIYSELQKQNNVVHKHHKAKCYVWGTITVLENKASSILRRVELNGKNNFYSTNGSSSQWAIISGTATITKNNKTIKYMAYDIVINKPHESLFIKNQSNEKFIFYEVINGNNLDDNNFGERQKDRNTVNLS